MVQEVMLMHRMSEQLGDKLVVWFICLDNDIYDNLFPNKPNYYTTPFVRQVNGTGQWEIVTHHVIRSKAYKPSGPSPYYPFLAHVCTPGPISDRAYSASDYLIDEAKAICDQSGAILVVMTIPNKHQLSPSGVSFLASHMYNAPKLDPGYPDLRIGEACQRLGIRFIALRDYLTPGDYKVRDVHWNEKGHRKVAEILDEIYVEYMCQGAKADQAVTRSGHGDFKTQRAEESGPTWRSTA
jgi:hypothetical protein